MRMCWPPEGNQRSFRRMVLAKFTRVFSQLNEASGSVAAVRQKIHLSCFPSVPNHLTQRSEAQGAAA